MMKQRRRGTEFGCLYERLSRGHRWWRYWRYTIHSPFVEFTLRGNQSTTSTGLDGSFQSQDRAHRKTDAVHLEGFDPPFVPVHTVDAQSLIGGRQASHSPISKVSSSIITMPHPQPMFGLLFTIGPHPPTE
jgi:hypothetical protein